MTLSQGYLPEDTTQPGYYQPVNPYQVNRDHPKAQTVLILGILSVTFVALCGPFAWVMGRKLLAEMDQAPPMFYANRSEAKVGMILGIVGTVFLVLSVLAFFLWGGLLLAMVAGMPR